MIFGADNRTKTASSPSLGYYVQILSLYPDGYSTQSSGVMIGSNDVLTAAHAVYDNSHGGYALEVEVIPSRFGDYEPYGSIFADNIFITQGWSKYEISYYDYALLSLDSAVGFETGWYEAEPLLTPRDLIGKTLLSYGYPGDLQNGNWLYATAGTPDAVHTNHLLAFQDDLDAYFGQSGSPLIYEEKVVALLISQFEDSNNALIINDSIYKNISEWASQNNQNLSSQPNLYTLEQSIAALYIAFFNRAPDYEGLNYWMQKAQALQDQNSLTKQIASEFAAHEIFAQTYSELDNRSFIEAVYQNILGASGDGAGMAYWENALNAKERYFVIDEILKATLDASLQSSEFASLTYSEYQAASNRQNSLKNKIEVSLAFSEMLNVKTSILATDDIFGDDAYLASQNILLNITQDEYVTQQRVDYITSIQDEQAPLLAINAAADLWI